MLKNIGKRIREIRISRGITQEHLAEKTNLSITCISRLENEKSMVSLEKIFLISDALNTNVGLILCDYITTSDQYNVDEVELINQYRLLSDVNKQNIQDFVNAMLKNCNNRIV